MSTPLTQFDVASPQGVANIILSALLIISELLAMIPKSPYRGVIQALGCLVTKMMADEKSIRSRNKSGEDVQQQTQGQNQHVHTVTVNPA